MPREYGLQSVYILAAVQTHWNKEIFKHCSIYNDQFGGDVENENQSESWIGICQVKYVPAIITHKISLEVNVQACWSFGGPHPCSLRRWNSIWSMKCEVVIIIGLKPTVDPLPTESIKHTEAPHSRGGELISSRIQLFGGLFSGCTSLL